MAFSKSKKGSQGAGPGSRSFKRFEERRDSAGFPWSRISGTLFVAAMDAATAHGVAVIIGSAQGGRGVVVTLLTEPERIKEYAATVGEFHEILVATIEEVVPQPQQYFAAYGLDPEELINAV